MLGLGASDSICDTVAVAFFCVKISKMLTFYIDALFTACQSASAYVM